MINIYDRKLVIAEFDNHPSQSHTLYVPGSGSWCETFDNKEQYIRRMDAWDKTLKGENCTPPWHELRGRISHPWYDEINREYKAQNPRSGSI